MASCAFALKRSVRLVQPFAGTIANTAALRAAKLESSRLLGVRYLPHANDVISSVVSMTVDTAEKLSGAKSSPGWQPTELISFDLEPSSTFASIASRIQSAKHGMDSNALCDAETKLTSDSRHVTI